MNNTNKKDGYFIHHTEAHKAYGYFGVHIENGRYVFRAWAPYAESVFLVGDFNRWGDSMPMQRIAERGVFEFCDTEGRVRAKDKYKFKIVNCGKSSLISDPYASETELPPNNASVVPARGRYVWRDDGWSSYVSRTRKSFYELPMNIYRVDTGSWKLRDDTSPLSFGELATDLSTYVKQMGYTHIELLPRIDPAVSAEFGSYSADLLYGCSYELKAFIDKMHEAGIGVILGWSPVNFNEGVDRLREDQICFFVSNAVYWLDEFHADGLMVNGVSQLLYPDGKNSRRCAEGEILLKRLNSVVKANCPSAIVIADGALGKGDTSDADGGLGFDLVLNNEWTKDVLSYADEDPLFRKHHHEKITFSLNSAFDEKILLSLSPNERGDDRAFFGRMIGDEWQRFASAKAFLAYQMTYPGKKLCLMGTEIGRMRRGGGGESLDWTLLDRAPNAGLQLFVSELNNLYLENPSLWQSDDSWDGFSWINANDRNHSIISYRRIDKSGRELIVVINFTPVAREDYQLGVPAAGEYEEIFNSDSERFGGSGVVNRGSLRSVGSACDFLPESVRMRVPPLGATVLKRKN